MRFSETILSWYAENRRDLPWRNTQNPYFIWLSEVILQQTRVNQGLSYYYRFTEHFPDLPSLAAAPEEEVLKLWQGLGYYSRARNMLAAAREIVKRGGVFPSSFKDLLSLKGIGEYTAAAIASFAFNEPVAVVDGNVYRLLSRYFGIETPIDSTQGKKEFKELAASLIDQTQPGTYNQAIMEFGAMQCKPSSPDCPGCPLYQSCMARSGGKVSALPAKARKTKQRIRYFNYLVIQSKSEILLNKRTQKDIWTNLYDFPLVETANPVKDSELLNHRDFCAVLGTKSFKIKSVSREYVHQLSHQKLFVRFWEIETPDFKQDEAPFYIVSEKDLPSYAVPRLVEKYMEEKAASD
jgi:A/G-specific adenine glycosylase